MENEAIERRMIELREVSRQYAKAAADREYLGQFRKSKKAMLMRQAEIDGHKTAASQEREAYAHTEYLDLLLGLRTATEAAEKLRWELEIARLGAELWRTQQANLRSERKGYGA